MDSSSRHWTIFERNPAPCLCPSCCAKRYAALCRGERFRPSLAFRMVHRFLRITAYAYSSQRSQPRPVASERLRSPVGARILVDAKLALLGSRGLPNQWRRP